MKGEIIEQLKIGNSMFEDIKHTDELGKEYWFARDLMPLLEYSKWKSFNKIIRKAIEVC